MNRAEFIMKRQIISNRVFGEYFKHNLKVVWFSEAFPSKVENKHNV